MEEFSIAPPPPASARRTSREPLSPTPEVTLESPFVITAPAPKRAPPQPPSDPFQSQLVSLCFLIGLIHISSASYIFNTNSLHVFISVCLVTVFYAIFSF